MKPRTKPLKLIALCTRELVEKPPLVIGLHGNVVTIVRDTLECVLMMAPEPCEHARKALEARICDKHNRPIVEIAPQPTAVRPHARPT